MLFSVFVSFTIIGIVIYLVLYIFQLKVTLINCTSVVTKPKNSTDTNDTLTSDIVPCP